LEAIAMSFKNLFSIIVLAVTLSGSQLRVQDLIDDSILREFDKSSYIDRV